MTLQDLLAALETGLPNRQADLAMWRMGRARPRFEAPPTDVVPDYVPRVTFDAGDALTAVIRLAPYASWRLAYDHQRNRHVFEICGQRGEAPMAATAICIGLVKHCIARRSPQMKIYDESAKAAQEAFANVAGFLTPPAVKLAMALKNHDTTEWDDDRWCSAISTLGVAPRDVLPELDRIKTVVATLRGNASSPQMTGPAASTAQREPNDMGELPWDDDEDGGTPLCPICGAYDTRSCEMRDEHGGECPWEMMREEDEAHD